MTIKDILKEKNISIYRLSKDSHVPYATCNDIVDGRTRLEKCSAETVYHIAHALNISMEDLLSPYFIKRANFENFKSTTCHKVKEQGDIDFIINTLESDDIRTYYNRKWYPESLYLLALLDFLCRENNIPFCDEYDDLRKCKLDKVVYPASIIALASVTNNDAILQEASMNSIPEFKRFNIIESEIRNVI